MRCFAAISVLCVLAASPAMAGFEWVPAPEIDRAPMTRAQNVYDNSLDVVPELTMGGGTDGMMKGELVINPYPVANNFSGGTDPFAAAQDNVGVAMLEESGALGSVPLVGGLSTGVKQPSTPPMAMAARESAFAMDPYPDLNKGDVDSEPLAPMELMPSVAPAPMARMNHSGLSAMPGGEVAPLPGYDRLAAKAPAGRLSPGRAQQPYMSPAPVNEQPAYVPSPVAPVPGGAFAEAVGFGRDLPLALALSQVIPSQYALSFGTGVDAGTSVSWEGGKPWNVVLQDILSPLGLRADIINNTVVIRGA